MSAKPSFLAAFSGRSSLRAPSLLVPALLGSALLGPALQAQVTSPFWSTYLGGAGREEITSVSRSPDGLITVAGFTRSRDLPVSRGAQTPFQAANAGGFDAFVARFDPAQPPAGQLVWCTYLGGAQDDFALDAEVDPATGITTIVGVSRSTGFPAASGRPAPSLRGLSDGFVVQLDARGGALVASMFVGGSGADHLCAVELGDDGSVAVAGVTESNDLPWTTGTVFPAARGGSTDAFVARLRPTNPPNTEGLWATYVGGSAEDGYGFSEFVRQGGWPVTWEGNLDRMDLALDPAGDLVLATTTTDSATPAVTTPNAVQRTHGGAEDVYIAVVDRTGGSLNYATFYGGSDVDRPSSLALHPAGGFVVGGYSFSNDLPVTPGCIQPTFSSCGGACVGWDVDGFICHLDPAAGVTRYSSYLGGRNGEDSITSLVVESSGEVVVTGYCVSGRSFPSTPRSLRAGLTSARFFGFVARLALRDRGADDLLHCSWMGGVGSGESWMNGVALDDVGNAIVVGSSNSIDFPVTHAFQPARAGGYDSVLVHIPMLPGCIHRAERVAASNACGVPLYTGVGGAPIAGLRFELTATNAPPGAPGLLVIGTPSAPVPLPPPLNGQLLVSPIATLGVQSDALGGASSTLQLSSSLPSPCPWGLGAQWVFLTNSSCRGAGPIATSARLEF